MEEYFGLRVLSAKESDPPPPRMYDPYNPPVLDAFVDRAPLTESDDYERCQEMLAEPFTRMCLADWRRTVVSEGSQESVSVVLLNGSEPTRFRIVFVGRHPGDVAEGVALSREYVAPPYWSGQLEFWNVPIYPPFERLVFLQLEWRVDDMWSGPSQHFYFAPCPPEYLGTECEVLAR